MQRTEKDIQTLLEGLTTYAIERQNGCERHQREGSPPWPVMRRFWTDAITQSMARLAGMEPDPGWMAQYDQRLWQARGHTMTDPAPLQVQGDTIRTLRKLVSSLEQAGDDRRRQTAVIRDLLDDMSLHLSWDWRRNGVDAAREDVERSLLRVTARLPIRFTRILLGGERGPCETGIIGGMVIEPEEVRETELFRSLSGRHPEVSVWPAICTTYAGAGGIGEEVSGTRRLRKEDIVFSDEICEVDGLLNFSLYCGFNVDEVFGTHVETGETDDYLNVYANYDMASGRVCDKLEITLCHGDGTDSYLCYRLDEAERAAVEARMEGYCFEQTGMGLREYSAQLMEEEPEQGGMQGPQM